MGTVWQCSRLQLLKDAICAAVAICRGAYLCELECTGAEAPQSATIAELITMVRSCTNEARRATEALRYLRDERAFLDMYCRARWRPLSRPPQLYSCGGPRCCSRAPCWRAARSPRAAAVAARRRHLRQRHVSPRIARASSCSWRGACPSEGNSWTRPSGSSSGTTAIGSQQLLCCSRQTAATAAAQGRAQTRRKSWRRVRRDAGYAVNVLTLRVTILEAHKPRHTAQHNSLPRKS